MEMLKVTLVTVLIIIKLCVSEEGIVENKVTEIINSEPIQNDTTLYVSDETNVIATNPDFVSALDDIFGKNHTTSETDTALDVSNKTNVIATNLEYASALDEIFGKNYLTSETGTTPSVNNVTNNIISNPDNSNTLEYIFGKNNKSSESVVPSKNEETIITTTQRSILTTIVNAIPKTEAPEQNLDKISTEDPSTESTNTNLISVKLPPNYNLETEQLNDNHEVSKNELELALNEIFGNENTIPEKVYLSVTEVKLESTTQAQKTLNTDNASTNDSVVSSATRIGGGEKEGQPRKKDFQFVNVDWDKDMDDNITESNKESEDNKPDLARRDYDGEDNAAEIITEASIDDDSTIIKYPIDEVEPAIEIEKPAVDVDNGTTTEDNESDEIATSIVSLEKDQPLSCYYGYEEFPYPEPKIVRTGRRIVDIKCEEQMWHMKYRVYDAKIHEGICADGEDTSTVVGGKISEVGAFPHMGAVGWLARDNRRLFFCGTSLITSLFSVTAAHCRSLRNRGDYGVDDINPKIVRFGIVDLSDVNSIERNIEQFLTPKEYDGAPIKKYNDIALIRFNKEITFTQYIQPACFWHTPMDELKHANVTGWGKTETENLSSTLKYAEIDMFDDALCNSILQNRKYRKWDRGLIDSQFCAGKLVGGVDTCQGDSGGPLQVWRPFPYNDSVTVHYVVGITSFGFQCGEPNQPGIYTKVNKFLCWLEKNIWPNEKNDFCP